MRIIFIQSTNRIFIFSTFQLTIIIKRPNKNYLEFAILTNHKRGCFMLNINSTVFVYKDSLTHFNYNLKKKTLHFTI